MERKTTTNQVEPGFRPPFSGFYFDMLKKRLVIGWKTPRLSGDAAGRGHAALLHGGKATTVAPGAAARGTWGIFPGALGALEIKIDSPPMPPMPPNILLVIKSCTVPCFSRSLAGKSDTVLCDWPSSTMPKA